MVDFEANAKEIVKDFQKFSVMMIGLKVRAEINREFEHTVKINNDIVVATTDSIDSAMTVLDTQLKGNYGIKVKETIGYQSKSMLMQQLTIDVLNK